jgi:hypothetical protein
VKVPSHVDLTTRYEGPFTLHIDTATNQPLAHPTTLPLEIDRRVPTLPAGGAHTAVLEEAVTYWVAGTTPREHHHYVIDRRSMQHRDDSRGWAFSPANRVVPGGHLPRDAPPGDEGGRTVSDLGERAGPVVLDGARSGPAAVVPRPCHRLRSVTTTQGRRR